MTKFDYLALKVDERDEKKQIGDLTNKLDELLDWMVRSPISDKDFDTIHKIYEKYVKKEEKE
tara:strand:+ start:192 stop:377 length:186 start_codon:yes stop_codon:yes gene_type:complete